MKLSTVLAGKHFSFRDVKDVLAKANENKSGDTLAGIAATSDLERIAANLERMTREGIPAESEQDHE